MSKVLVVITDEENKANDSVIKRRCREHLLKQTFKDFEISENFSNKSFFSKSQYTALLDISDYWDSEFLERLVAKLEFNQNLKAIYSYSEVANEVRRSLPSVYEGEKYQYVRDWPQGYDPQKIPRSSMVFRTDFLADKLNLQSNLNNLFSRDKLIKNKDIAKIDELLAHVQLHFRNQQEKVKPVLERIQYRSKWQAKRLLNKPLAMFESAPFGTRDRGNFGDLLSHTILEQLFGVETYLKGSEETEISVIGSILERLAVCNNNRKPYVWGSGYLFEDDSVLSCKKAKVFAVRGKKSLERIIDVPKNRKIAIGDPGILINLAWEKLYPDFQKQPKKYKLGIVPNHAELEPNSPVLDLINQLTSRDDILLIEPIGVPLEKIAQIVSCENIASSSLHGLITADSFDIPNINLKMSNLVTGGNYKFDDYYSIYNQKRQQIIKIEDIVNLSTSDIVSLIQNRYIKPTDLPKLQENLIDAFPVKGLFR
ncbi:MAG: polysaccharide pyruvyl transferase family protein [Candidatus Ancillula sp.]|jgi:hypothetical protein|nr:polysaccharide pyruvyl transferase family protein [Candidatus Ancillula sp.]